MTQLLSRARWVCLVLATLAAGCQDVVWNEYAGQTRSQIIATLGRPTREENGRTGMGHPAPDGPVWETITLVYEDHARGLLGMHPGSLYIATRAAGDDRECYESAWVPRGTTID